MRRTASIILTLALCLPLRLMAQPLLDPFTEEVQDTAGEFAFVRLQYDNYYDDGFGYGTWRTDFPSSDTNFLRGVSRLSNVRVMKDPIVLRLDDDRIFNYPFIYALEMGRNGGPLLSKKEKNFQKISIGEIVNIFDHNDFSEAP